MTTLNPLDHIPPAGRPLKGRDEGAHYCLDMSSVPQDVPAVVAKWARRTVDDVGTRSRHPAFREDPPRAATGKEVFGVPSSRAATGLAKAAGSASAAEALDHSRPPLEQYAAEQAEALLYKSVKRAPLGKPAVQGTQLPTRMRDGTLTARETVFGKASGHGVAPSGDAKEALFPPTLDAEAEARGAELYAKSHGNVAPGVRNTHGLNWATTGLDPGVFAFGRKAAAAEAEGAVKALNPTAPAAVREAMEGADIPVPSLRGARIVPKVVEDRRVLTTAPLGRSQGAALLDTTKHPERYGVAPKPEEKLTAWSAGDCLRGAWSIEDQQPDADLGRSRGFGIKPTPGHVPDPSRRFGLPSIRTDVPPRNGGSLANPTDYGEGVGAGPVLCPDPYADIDVGEADFTVPRGPAELRRIFAGAGFPLEDAEFEAVYARACSAYSLTPSGSASVEEFRRALDEVADGMAADELDEQAVARANRVLAASGLAVAPGFGSTKGRAGTAGGSSVRSGGFSGRRSAVPAWFVAATGTTRLSCGGRSGKAGGH